MKITYTVQESIEKEVPKPKYKIGQELMYTITSDYNKRIRFASIVCACFSVDEGNWKYELSSSDYLNEEDIEYFLKN